MRAPVIWPRLIKKLCEDYGLTPHTLAMIMRVADTTVANWIAGRARPRRFDAVVLVAMNDYKGEPHRLKRCIEMKRSAKSNPIACSHLLHVLIGKT